MTGLYPQSRVEILCARIDPAAIESDARCARIVCISDTHEQEARLHIPKCDLLIHAGEMTYGGDRHKLLAFDEWCAQLPLARDRILVSS